jgi:transcriptional regulator with XRE-family HTH domain
MNNLGKILKHIRVFNDLTQLELSKKLNISRSYISEIESGKKIPTLEVLKDYSVNFKIALSAIMLFAENYEEKINFKNTIKKGLTGTALKFLDWITKKER